MFLAGCRQVVFNTRKDPQQLCRLITFSQGKIVLGLSPRAVSIPMTCGQRISQTSLLRNMQLQKSSDNSTRQVVCLGEVCCCVESVITVMVRFAHLSSHIRASTCLSASSLGSVRGPPAATRHPPPQPRRISLRVLHQVEGRTFYAPRRLNTRSRIRHAMVVARFLQGLTPAAAHCLLRRLQRRLQQR